MRFSDRLTVSVDVSPEAYRCSLPSLLLQPVVENAIKYAIAQSEEGGTIALSAKVDKGRLVLHVDDSGADGKLTDTQMEERTEETHGLALGCRICVTDSLRFTEAIHLAACIVAAWWPPS